MLPFRRLLLLAAVAVSAVGLPVVRAATGSVPERPVAGKNRLTVDALTRGRVLILGDSITQNGGYIGMFEYFLEKKYPEKSFDIIAAGLASETVNGVSEKGHAGGAFPRPCLHERLGRALAAVKPKLVLACYGMNDGIYRPYDEVRMKAFETGMQKLATACREAGADLVLITPPVFDHAHARFAGDHATYNAVLGRFAEWEIGNPPPGVVGVIDLHTPMSAALAARQKADPRFRFAGDGVHPGEAGNLFMALELLKGFGVTPPEGSLESVLGGMRKDPLFAPVARRRAARSNAWLRYIGYTRENKVPPGTGDIAAAEKAAADRQHDIDRLRRPAR